MRVDWTTKRWRRCHYCGVRMTAENRTVDHIVPRASGGTDAFINLVAACSDCNQRKADFLSVCECLRCARARAYHASRMLADDRWDRATIVEFRNG